MSTENENSETYARRLFKHKAASVSALMAAVGWGIFAEVLLWLIFAAAGIATAAVASNTFGENPSIGSAVAFWFLLGVSIPSLVFAAVMSSVRSYLSHKRHDRAAELAAELHAEAVAAETP